FSYRNYLGEFRLVSTTNMAGDTASVTLFPGNWGTPMTLTDESGATTRVDYFPGQVRVTSSLGKVVTYNYLNGALSQVIDENGLESLYTRDSRNRITKVVDPFGHTTFYAYDA